MTSPLRHDAQVSPARPNSGRAVLLSCCVVAASIAAGLALDVPMGIALSGFAGVTLGVILAGFLVRLQNAPPAFEVQAPINPPAVGLAGGGAARVDAASGVGSSTAPGTDATSLFERLNKAAQAAGVRIFDWDVTGSRLNLDETRLNAYSSYAREAANEPDEFVKRMVHPEDLASFRREIGAALKSKTQFVMSYRALQADGVSARPVQLHGQVSRDGSGRAIRVLGVTIDMSAQEEAARRIEQQNAEQRRMLQRLDLARKAGGIGVWDWDIRNDRYSADASIARAHGLDELQVLRGAREFFTQQVHVDDRDRFSAALDAALAQGETFSHRHRVILPNGKLRHVQIHSHIERDGEGAAARMFGITMDVAAEVRRAEQLQGQAADERAVRDRLDLATRTANIGVWDMDLTTRAITTDEITRRLFGCEGEVDESTLFETVHPEDRAEVFEATKQRVVRCEDGGSVAIRLRVNAPAGEIRHLQTHVRVSKNADGRPVRVLGVTWDVTSEVNDAAELRQHAQHARDLLARLSIAAESARIGSWEIDIPGNRYVWVENVIHQLRDVVRAGSSLDELTARVHPDDRQALPNALRAALASKSDRVSCRYRAFGPDGHMLHIQVHARLLLENGRLTRLLGVSWDVTPESDAAEALERQAQHERMLRARLNIAAEAAGISFWEFDLTTKRFILSEESARALHGVLRLHGTESEFMERVLPEDRGIFDQVVRAAYAAGKDRVSYQYRVTADDGRLLHIQSHARLMFGEDGRAHRLLGVSSDITREIEATERLEAQTRHERMLLDRLSIANQVADICSWEIDLVTKQFLYIENPVKALNREISMPLKMQDLSAIVLEEDRDVMAVEISRALDTGTDRMTYVYRAYAPDRRVVHVKNFVKLIVDAAGRPTRALGVSWDVTSEVEAAERLALQARRLQDAERRLERASLSSSEGHWEAEMPSGALWLSSSYRALLGEDNPALPRNMSDMEALTYPDDYPAMRDLYFKHLKFGAPYMVDVRLRMSNGEYRWFRQRGTAERDANGQADFHVWLHSRHPRAEAGRGCAAARAVAFRTRDQRYAGWVVGAGSETAKRGVRRASASCSAMPRMSCRATRTSCGTSCIRTTATSSPPRRRRISSRTQPYDVEIRLRTKSRRVSLVSCARQGRTRRGRPAPAPVGFAAGCDRSARRARGAAARDRSGGGRESRQELSSSRTSAMKFARR